MIFHPPSANTVFFSLRCMVKYSSVCVCMCAFVNEGS